MLHFPIELKHYSEGRGWQPLLPLRSEKYGLGYSCGLKQANSIGQSCDVPIGIMAAMWGCSRTQKKSLSL
jgi:hypothetical protein